MKLIHLLKTSQALEKYVNLEAIVSVDILDSNCIAVRSFNYYEEYYNEQATILLEALKTHSVEIISIDALQVSIERLDEEYRERINALEQKANRAGVIFSHLQEVNADFKNTIDSHEEHINRLRTKIYLEDSSYQAEED